MAPSPFFLLPFCFFFFCNRHEVEHHGRNYNSVVGERDEYGYFYCLAGCGNVFSTKASRKRYCNNVYISSDATLLLESSA